MRYFALALVLLTACAQQPLEAHTDTLETIPMTPTPSTFPITVDITPDPVLLLAEVPQMSECAEWTPEALRAGWDEEHLDRLGYILWRESRCQPDAFNGNDPNSGSFGLAQINGFWCRPSTHHPEGWLQGLGILISCNDLHDPLVNLVAAKAIWDYGVERGNCPWGPWTTKNTRWCA
jgi:hypothetical protein